MKNIFVAFAVLLPILMYGQTDHDTYLMRFSGGEEKEFKIQFSENKGELEDVLIFAQSLDEVYSNTVFIIKEKNLNSFISYLKQVKQKFEEWSETAFENKVSDFSKDIDVSIRDKYRVAFGARDWNYDGNVRIKSIFRVIDGESSVLIYTGELRDTFNKYIKSKGLAINFMNGHEIDEFIEKIDIDKMKESLKKDTDTSSLFK